MQKDCGLHFTAASNNPRPRLPWPMLHVSGTGHRIVLDLQLPGPVPHKHQSLKHLEG